VLADHLAQLVKRHTSLVAGAAQMALQQLSERGVPWFAAEPFDQA
jgi:hypothetical protein